MLIIYNFKITKVEKGKCVGNQLEPSRSPFGQCHSLEMLCAANRQALLVLADRSPLRHLGHTDLLRSQAFHDL